MRKNIKFELEKLGELTSKPTYIFSDEELFSHINEIFDFISEDYFSAKFVFDILKRQNRFENTKKFIKSFESQNGSIDCEVFSHKNSLGLKSTADSEIFRLLIPRAETFDLTNIQSRKEFHEINKDYLLKKHQNVKLAFFILLEFYRLEKSPFWPYFISLPFSVDNICSISKKDFESFFQTHHFRYISSLFMTLLRHYSYLHLKLINLENSGEKNTKKFLFEIQASKKFSLCDFLWACSIVLSRNFGGAGKGFFMGLVPILDLVNQCSSSPQPIFFEDYRIFSGLVIRNVKKGQEILMNYSNSRDFFDFYLCNGFVEKNYKAVIVRVSIPYSKIDSLKNEKINFLEKFGMKNYLQVFIKESDWWKGENLIFLRVYAANKDEISKFGSLDKDKLLEVLVSDEGVSKRNESFAVLVLKKRLLKVVEDYKNFKSSMESGKSRSKLLKCAFSVIKSEIKIIKNAIIFLDEKYEKIK